MAFNNYSDVCTKYQEAAKIVNLALTGIIEQCKPGAKILDLCEFGHTVINTSAQRLFTKKVNGQPIERGVAFPVCISVNDCICNYSPLPEEERVSYTTGGSLLTSTTCSVTPSAPRSLAKPNGAYSCVPLWFHSFDVKRGPTLTGTQTAPKAGTGIKEVAGSRLETLCAYS